MRSASGLGFAAVAALFAAYAPQDACAQALASAASTAEDDAAETSSAASDDGRLPIADLLAAIGLRYGWSFVFDARLVENRRVAPIADAADVAAALNARLKEFALTLEKVGATTYAVRPDVPATEAVSPPPPSAETPDLILVTSTLADSPPLFGARALFEPQQIDLEYVDIDGASEAIYDLPQSLASITPSNSVLLGLSAGLSFADLRGLEPKRTAVLIDGRMRTESPGGNGDVLGFDLGVVPVPFLNRIEIESRPAGARLAAKAVAGAVNFALKRGLSTTTTGVGFGISARADSIERTAFVLSGRDFAAGAANVTAGAMVINADGLVGADRPSTASPYGYALYGRRSSSADAILLPGFGGSVLTQRGYVSGVVQGGVLRPTRPSEPRHFGADGILKPFDGSLDQLYNYSADQSVILPVRRAIGYAAASWSIGPSTEIFAESLASKSRQDGRLAALPAPNMFGADAFSGDAIVAPINHPTVSAALSQQLRAQYGSTVEAFVLDRRYAELGPRLQRIDRTFGDMRLGVEVGDLASRGLSLSYRYGRADTRVTDYNRADSAKVKVALDVAACAAAAGCAAADFFAPGGLSQDALRFLSAPPLRKRIAITDNELDFVARTAIGGPDWSGLVSAGVDVKATRIVGSEHTPPGVLPVGDLSLPRQAGRLGTTDVFWGGEARLARSPTLIGEIFLSEYFRATMSPTFGAAWNFEGAASWSPDPVVVFQAAYYAGERPPNVVELFGAGPRRGEFVIDPCSPSGAASDAALHLNCLRAENLVTPLVQTARLATRTLTGSSALQPETVRTQTFGVTLTPFGDQGAPPGRLVLSAIWTDTRIDDAIEYQNDAFSACYSGSTCPINPATGEPIVRRDPATRQIVAVDLIAGNTGARRWRGLDLSARWRWRPGGALPVDDVWLSGQHTYIDRMRTLSDGVWSDAAGGIDAPKHRSLISAGASRGPIRIAAFLQRRSAVSAVGLRPDPLHVSAATTVDLHAAYEMRGFRIEIGAENVADVSPPIIPGAGAFSTRPEYYDVVGRRFSATLSATW